MSKEAISKSPSGRVRRTSIGTRNILSVSGKEEGYHYRFVNDVGDRIEQFKAGGWEHAPAATHAVGDKRINNASAEGTHAQASVGGGEKAYLMRIKQEWYDEDQAAKSKAIDNLEATTKQKALNGTYGQLEISRD